MSDLHANKLMENMKDLEDAVGSMRHSLESLKRKMIKYNEMLIEDNAAMGHTHEASRLNEND